MNANWKPKIYQRPLTDTEERTKKVLSEELLFITKKKCMGK